MMKERNIMDIVQYDERLVLPRDPLDFSWKLRSRGMDTSHEKAFLVLGYDVLGYMEDWSFSYYYDHFRLVTSLYNLALIGTRVQIGDNQFVVVDQILVQTPKMHKCIYRRNESVIVTSTKLHFATMEPRP